MEILQNKKIEEQSQEVQDYLNENVLPHISFGEGFNSVDEYNRPLTWVIDNVTVTAHYYTNNINLTFNYFTYNGTI